MHDVILNNLTCLNIRLNMRYLVLSISCVKKY